jgi:hypothetical protein
VLVPAAVSRPADAAFSTERQLRAAETFHIATLPMLGGGGDTKRRHENADMMLTMPARRSDCSAPHDALPMIDGGGTVIQFRPRRLAPRRRNDIPAWQTTDDSPVSDIDRFEYTPETDEDYRNRMRVNFVAAVFLMVLLTIGDWVINAMVQAQQTQYCYLLDAGHCATSYIPVGQHG